tara:strand:+ start:232 stop:738 length:507 start_codon:yes stop_codon:yes gene_type:complete
MANTDIFKYSTNERLGKMDVDVLTLTPVCTTNACAVNEVIFQADMLSDIVSVNAGACMIHSIGLLDDDDNGQAIDLVFMDTTGLLDASEDGTVIDAADGVIPDAILGVVSITTYFDGVLWQYGHKENVGLVLKATDDTKKIYISGVNRGSTATWTASGLRLKIGVIKD